MKLNQLLERYYSLLRKYKFPDSYWALNFLYVSGKFKDWEFDKLRGIN